MRTPFNAYVALGGNIGDRLPQLRMALQAIARMEGARVPEFGIAGLYETSPLGGPPAQQAYLNSAVRVQTTLDPPLLLNELLGIERALGRTRGVRWESRVIDLDLLLFDQVICQTPALTLPHPRMHCRLFVLEPLTEIGGDIVHPVLGRTIADLATEMRQDPAQAVTRIAGPQWAGM